MKSIYFVLDKNILPKTITIEWKSAIISRAASWQAELYLNCLVIYLLMQFLIGNLQNLFCFFIQQL